MKHQRIGIGVGLRARPSSKKIVTVLLSFSVVAVAVPALAVAPAAASGGGLDIGHTFVTTITATKSAPFVGGTVARRKRAGEGLSGPSPLFVPARPAAGELMLDRTRYIGAR